MLELYLGPMFAGKTTHMIRSYKTNESDEKIAIDYNGDATTPFLNDMLNHNNVALRGVYNTLRLNDLWSFVHDAKLTIHRAKYIYINECQFFGDLKEFVLKCLKENKHVYLFGLDGDFKQQLFGQTTELIPYCTYIEKVKGVCHTCSNPSIASYRTTKSEDLVILDSSQYIPLCLECLQDTY
tara:strand:+ start:26 stop:571 length:546 start_codon:yes stop_codon:yes gene_type:complete